MRGLWTMATMGAGLVAMLAAPGDRGQDNRAIPPDILAALSELRETFVGTGGLLEPNAMARALARHKEQIAKIMHYAQASSNNAELLARRLAEPLEEYAARFAAGREIDEQWLKPRTTRWPPEHGLTVDAYLLLELADLRQSPAFTRNVLSLLCHTMAAHSHLVEKRTLYRHPELAEEAAREKREIGPPVGNLGREIAWSCERFMVDAYLAEEEPFPEPGMAVVTEFWKWRKRRMLDRGRPHCLDDIAYNTTMSYIAKLAEALPGQ